MTEIVVEKTKEQKAAEWANVQAFYDLVWDNYDFCEAYRLLTEDEQEIVDDATLERDYQDYYDSCEDDDD